MVIFSDSVRVVPNLEFLFHGDHLLIIWFLYIWHKYRKIYQKIDRLFEHILKQSVNFSVRDKRFFPNQFLNLIASPQILVLSFQIAYSALNFLLLNRHLRHNLTHLITFSMTLNPLIMTNAFKAFQPPSLWAGQMVLPIKNG